MRFLISFLHSIGLSIQSSSRGVWHSGRSLASLALVLSLSAPGTLGCGGKVVVDGDPPGTGAALGLDPSVDGDPCAPNHIGFKGSIDGKPIRSRYLDGGGVYGFHGCMEKDFAREGFYVLYGPGFDSNGALPSTEGWLRFPGDEFSPPGFYCSESATSVMNVGINPAGDVDKTDFHWSTLRRADACPGGSPVTGQVTIGESGLAGSIDGQAVANGFSSDSQDNDDPDYTIYSFEGCAFAGVSFDDVDRGFLLLPDANGTPKLYCLGAISSNGTFDHLTKVGGCADTTAITGDLSVCDH